ncbi:von Willebrand factor A domain-containing protein 8 [Liparis tanakae]|uniref:von Willebrand factor A domain-containing protein 8 n=1 Tax=Liparis tanakae TaxID=230148 RepID=A0A4Z2IMY5_9TELE|nr:von Willebrand factor A domain-containing protein 8 [Liparis tanakae]
MTGYWTINQAGNARRKLLCPTESRPIDGPVFLRVQGYPCSRQESRALSFSEEKAHWQIPMNEVNIICDVATKDDVLYVATCNPVSLYSMEERGETIRCMELYDVFPRTISGTWQPFVTVAPLGSPLDGQVVLHEEQRGHRMCHDFAHKNCLLFYKEDGNELEVLDVLEGRVHTISLPVNLKSVHLVAEDRWLLLESGTNKKFLLTKPMHMMAGDSGVCQLHAIGEDGVSSGHGITIQRDSNLDVTAPKHGKTDPNNDPHVGGNQWAGGTGGRDTAGLGGKGGPYRLDAGHKVHQVSQAEKDAVPEEVRRAAREMGEKAFKERLKEIDMSEYDAAMYERFSSAVRRQVQSLRIVLDSLQAKGKEREWLKNQALGELDDAKIIDGLTGEKAIYKRRAELDPEPGSPQQKPKRLRVLVDVSGSMYRFNGVDGRLERSMEAVCMVMEALESYEHRFKYDIVGHSGDGYDIELVRADKVPKNNKERLKVIKNMHAHSQFCMSGDYTLEGTAASVKELAREEADEHFLVVLSDANLERYGIRPERFAQVLTSDTQVNAFAIFIGSLGDQAERLQKTLPAGRSFVAMDTKHIPQILQQIFTSTMLSNA